jgi:hypothetical protein
LLVPRVFGRLAALRAGAFLVRAGDMRALPRPDADERVAPDFFAMPAAFTLLREAGARAVDVAFFGAAFFAVAFFGAPIMAAMPAAVTAPRIALPSMIVLLGNGWSLFNGPNAPLVPSARRMAHAKRRLQHRRRGYGAGHGTNPAAGGTPQ